MGHFFLELKKHVVARKGSEKLVRRRYKKAQSGNFVPKYINNVWVGF